MAPAPPPSPDELFSADFDGELTEADRFSKRSSDSTVQTKSWQRLGDSLRDLPVNSASGLAERVRHRIETNQRPVLQSIPASEGDPPQVTDLRKPIALLASSCAILLMAINVSLQHFDQPHVAISAFSSVLDPTAWEIVVVTISDQQESLLTEQLRESVGQRGYRIHSLTSGLSDRDDSLELVMASAETSEQFLDALSADSSMFEAEWNPEQIGKFNREELLQKFAESMHTPTESDRFFGETFVVLPTSDSVQISSIPTAEPGDAQLPETIAAARNAADEVTLERLATNPDERTNAPAAATNEERLMERLQQDTARPVLVVFRKKPKLQSDARDFPVPNRA